MKVIHAENSLDMAGSSDTWPSQHFELLRTFRSALACKDITTNNYEQLRQIIQLSVF
jgi:hypothetical protein